MEFGTREILIGIGILVILAILLDGVRRVRAAKSGTIRMSKRQQPVFDDQPLDEYGSELPSGPARVVSVRDDDSVQQLSEVIKQSAEQSAVKRTTVFQHHAEQKRGAQAPQARVTPAAAERDANMHVARERESLEDDGQPEPGQQPETASRPDFRQQESTPPADATRHRRAEPARPSRTENAHRSGAGENRQKRSADLGEQEVIVLHLMAARGERFAGKPLLDALLKQGFRYGSMKIFHRHQQADGSGEVLYSVANSVNPGTFDLNSIEDFSTPGVTFFMALNGLDTPVQVFDQLCQAARNMASELDGELKDETRSALTRQTVEHYRQRILDFTRRSFALSS